MKTAMQELLEWHRLSMRSYSETNKMIEALLEKEKEQIINFAYEILATSDEHQSGYVSIEEIYNQTYKSNKL
jgi:hypothetical protein